MPVTSTLADEISAVTKLVESVMNRARGWHGQARALHRRDMDRVENPRKGPDVERNADVGRHIRNA
jgi:hypothetical protein